MNSASFRINFGEFDRALSQYMSVTTHTLPEVLNKKALFICRRALRETPKADSMAIKQQLGVVALKITGQNVSFSKSGVRRGKFLTEKVYAPSSQRASISLAEAIIRARAYRAGKSQPTKSEMPELIESLVASRMRSTAFLKSGWIPAIRTLSGALGNHGSASAGGAKMSGQPKGRAIPARAGLKCTALIENSVRAEGKRANDSLVRFGGRALQEAVNAEEQSMQAEVFRRQAEAAKAVGIKVITG
ncbi:MAG TPA: hypothetical protein VG167_18930 [Verrucomicrobiae bacterium]|nr:hypothetical protein [Verrucomicrobiae bacterium]